MTKKVEMYMSDILVALVEESASLPSDVLEILLAQFVPKNAVSIRLTTAQFTSPYHFLSAWITRPFVLQ